MNKLLLVFQIVLIQLISINLLMAQSKVPFSPARWDQYEKTNPIFEEFEGTSTVRLEGKIFVKDLNIEKGTIEVDVFANKKRSFAGLIFRRQNHDMDDVYMRTHKSGQADAVQYTPIYNGETSWQLYREYQANVEFNQTGWNTLKVVFSGQYANVFVNGNRVLVIDSLRTGNETGSIGLFSLFENRFANFSYSHNTDELVIPEAKPDDTSVGIIRNWAISDAKPFTDETTINESLLAVKYRVVSTERSGLLPISKFLAKPSFGNFGANSEAYTIVKHEIIAEKIESKIFSFDYSDKIIVFLNGKKIFSGNNAFRSKGDQFMGHLDINSNQLVLQLNKGKNTLHCVVIDKANGWGIIGKVK